MKNRLRKPTRQGVIQFIWFNVGGIVFFVIGYLCFVVFYGLFHWPWLPAKILADFLGWSANFAIQYFLAFSRERQGQKPHAVAGRFTFISLINLIIDYAIVGFLNWIGVSPFIGLFIAAGFFTIWKWLWYRYWVFKKRENVT